MSIKIAFFDPGGAHILTSRCDGTRKLLFQAPSVQNANVSMTGSKNVDRIKPRVFRFE